MDQGKKKNELARYSQRENCGACKGNGAWRQQLNELPFNCPIFRDLYLDSVFSVYRTESIHIILETLLIPVEQLPSVDKH